MPPEKRLWYRALILENGSGLREMSVDRETVKRVAHLARIAVSDDEAEALKADLNKILGFVDQLIEVDVSDVEPMASAGASQTKLRDDVVDDGDKAEAVLANAPDRRDGFFAVPKVVE